MKQKKWLVSVMKNKPLQQLKDIDFFTTDTRAELVFELTDKEVRPETATVSLYNKRDKSLVSEEHPVSNGAIKFPMHTRSRNVIEHAGQWVAQVIFEQNGQKYTTRQITFGVAGNILDDNIPSLDIKENMNNLILQLEQAVRDAKAKIKEVDGTLERAEAKRVANETERLLKETKRQAKEQERQASEGGRVKAETTRETQEDTRQLQEATREDNEGERITLEAARKDSEAIRSDAEAKRATSESSRKDSESVRQNAEDERKTNEAARLANESDRELAESTRKENEATRISNMEIVQGWIANPEQFDGKSIEYNWRGTELGVRLEGDVDYVYVNLKGEAGAIENLEPQHIQSALGFVPKDYQAGDNIAITGDVISVVGQLGLTEEEVRKVKVDKATDADTVAGHTVAKDVPADANFNDTIVDITGKADQVDLDSLQSQLTELLGESVVSESGHMGIRIWQEKFEYWDGIEWVEIEIGGGGPAIKVGNVSDLTANAKLGNKIDIAWNDPDDVVLEGATLAQWTGTQLRRSEGTYPTDETQGTLIADSTVRNQYSTGYEDANLTEGTEYFYALFPYTESGQFTIDPANRASATAFNKYKRTAPSVPTVKDIVLLEATVTGGSGSVVSLDQSNWFSSPHTFTGLTEGMTYTPYSKFEETAEYYESAVVAGSSFTAIAKGTQPAPSAPTISNLEFDRVTVAGVAGTEVRLDSGSWRDSPHTFTGLTEETSYTAYARMKETPTKLASPSSAGKPFVTEAEQKIYGVEIDESNSNPETSVAYTDDAVGFTPAKGNNGNFSWGSWEAIIKEEFRIAPVVLNNPQGTVNYYLNYNDYTKKASGGNSNLTGSDGDVMIEFGQELWWRLNKVGSTIQIQLSVKPFDGAVNHAFDIEGGYNQLSFYPLTMLQIIFLLMFKNRDTQTALGRGYVDGNSNYLNTGSSNNQPFMYGETTGKQQIKFLGIEDYWGNRRQWIDGVFYDNSENITIGKSNFNDAGNGYTNYGKAQNTGGGYISKVYGNNNQGFIPAEFTGSDSTYYPDYGYLHSGRMPYFGGHRSDGSSAGGFRMYSYTASYAHAALGGRCAFYSSSTNKLYIGVYLGSTASGKLRSVSGKDSENNKAIGAFRDLAKANN